MSGQFEQGSRAHPAKHSARAIAYSNGSGNLCSRLDPVIVAFEFQTKPVVIDCQVTVALAGDRLRHNLLHFLGHHADIRFVAPVVTEAIETKAVVETAEQNDVVFEPDIRASSTAAATSAARVHSAAPTTTSPQAVATTAGAVCDVVAAGWPIACRRTATVAVRHMVAV